LHQDDQKARSTPTLPERIWTGLLLHVSDARTLLEGLARTTPWLSTIAREHVRSHLKHNRTSRLLRYGRLRRALAILSHRPAMSLALVLLIYLGALIVTWRIPFLSWGPRTPASAEDYFRDFQTINLALVGAQATLLGLVYPLIIALVSLLFQETAARGARLNVYFKETEATAVGGMALFFIAVVSGLSLFYGQMPVRVVAAITAMNLLWFVFNLIGIGFFVRNSLNFIRPAGRHRMLESYVANTAWPAQFLAFVRAHTLLGAPARDYLESPAEVGSVGLINPIALDPPIARLTLARPLTLVDIAFGRLNAVLRGQKRGAALGRPPAAVTFAPLIDRDYPEGPLSLARGSGTLSKAERLVLKNAYRFGRPDRRNPSSLTEHLLTELVASAHAQFEAGNFDQFGARIDEATQLHVRLYELAANPRLPGTDLSNSATLGDGWHSLDMSWVAAYRDLLNRAGDRIEREPRFFERLIYIPSRVHRRVRTVAPPEARKALFHLAIIPILALLDRAGREKADASPSGAPMPAIFNFGGGAGEKYKRFWINAVGGWESFGEAVGSLGSNDGETPNWRDLRALADELFRHLSDTAMLTAKAAQIGEVQAMGWTADLLMNWRNRTIRRLGQDRGGWALHRPLLTLRHARLSWVEIEAAPVSLNDQPKAPQGVFGAVMENAWFDVVVVTLANLLAKCPDPVAGVLPESGAGQVSLALYHNRTFDPGASGPGLARQMDLGTLLRSLLRKADRGNGYGADLDAITERIDQLEGPHYVSGRVYSWSGLGGEGAIADPQIVLLASTTAVSAGRRHAFAIGEDTRRMLLPEDDGSRRRILDHLSDFLRRADEADLPRASALLSMLLERPVDLSETEARIAVVKDVLTTCRAVIEAERLTTLQTAQFDPQRIAAIEAKIAETAFTPKEFPLMLFGTVGRVEGPLERFTFRLNGLRRGAYTSPQLEEAWTDGDDYLRQHYTPLVASRILLDALQSRRPIRRSPRTPEGWWRSVKEGIASIRAAGMVPLIIRGARNEPPWMLDWHYDPMGEARPSDMLLEYRNGQGDGYDFHLNEVPVYSDIGAQNATWIVAREMFSRVEFEDFGGGKMVRAQMMIEAEDPWKASLAIEWGRKVTVAETPLWKVTHPAE